jgi:hypothetical protein
MPTIPDLAQRNNEYPDAPPAIDVNPAQFGRDAAAMANLGGDVAQFGNKLIAARKAAMESDVVANAKTEDTIQLDKDVDELKKTWNPNNPESAAEGLREKMNGLMQNRMKAMPTGDAQRMYRDRMTATMESKYLDTLKWENQSRAAFQLENLAVRTDKASAEVYNSPNLAATIEHLKDLDLDIKSKAGISLEVADAPVIYNKLGGNLAKSYFSGIAESAVEMSPDRRIEAIREGRKTLKNLPPELKPLLSGEDIRVLEGRFDAAEREGKVNDAYIKDLEKQALAERRDKEQNQILTDIFEGRGSVKNILRSNLDPDKKQTMLGVLKARLNEPKVPNQNALRGVVERIYAEPGDPRKITSEDQVLKLYTKGDLTWTQKNQALGELRNLGKVGGQVETDLKRQLMKQAESKLAKPNAMGMVDPDGQENLAKFTSFMLSEIEAAKKAGKPVRDLLDANSPSYLGKAIANYQKTPQQIMKSQVEQMKAQKLKQTTQAITVPQPKGTVLMLDPSGKRFYVPAANEEKARARGFKPAGRSPQSLGKPEVAFDADAELETYYGGYKSEEEMVDAIVSNKDYTPEQRLEILDEVQLDLEGNSYELSDTELARLKTKVDEEIERAYVESPESRVVVRKKESPKKGEAKGSDEDEDKLAKLPRGRTDAEEAAIRERLKAARDSNRNARLDKRKKK